MSDEIVEMRWRCPDGMCAVENRGLTKVCRSCSRPKGPDVEDYFPDGDGSSLPALTSQIDLEKATANGALAGQRADRACYRCGTAQWRMLGACENCGAPLAESKRDAQELRIVPRTAVEVLFDPPKPPPAVRRASARPSFHDARSQSWAVSASVTAMRTQNKVVWCIVALMCAALLLGGMYLGCRTTDADVVVTHVAWVHSAKMRCMHEIPSGGFDPPGDAIHIKDVGMRHHHYDDVFDHWEPTDESHWDKVPDGEEEYTCTVKVKGPKPPCYRGTCVKQGNGTAACPKVCPEAPTIDDPNGRCKRAKFKKIWVQKTGRKPVTRPVSREKMWRSWSVPTWVRVPERDASESGLTLELLDPHPASEPGLRCEAPIERSYDVGLTDAQGTTTVIHPRSAQEFMRFPRESRHVLRSSLLGGVEIDPPGTKR